MQAKIKRDQNDYIETSIWINHLRRSYQIQLANFEENVHILFSSIMYLPKYLRLTLRECTKLPMVFTAKTTSSLLDAIDVIVRMASQATAGNM